MQKILFKITFLCCFLWSLCSFAQDSTSAKYILPKKAIQYDWISYQLKIDLALPDRQEALNAFFVNRKDSIIYLNINKSGYELARVVLTPKTVIYVNRPNTEYYKGNYAFLSQKLGFPLTFNMIQALMTGETCPNYTIFSEYEKKDGLEYYLDNYRIFPPQKSYYSEDIEYNPTSKHIISHSL